MFLLRCQRVAVLTFAIVVAGAAVAADLPDRRPAPAPTAPADNVPAPAAAPPRTQRQELVELYTEVEALQTQLREMRDQQETTEHELDRLKIRYRDSLTDFDKRLRELERRGSDPANTSEPTAPVAGTPPPATRAPASPPSAAEQQQYDAAFAQMKQGMYEQAGKSFREYVSRFPQGPLTANAQYWVGETAYVMRDFRGALDGFGKVVSDFPQSPKAADALLKIGYTHYELGAYGKAREALKDVVKRYPNTTASKAAELRLTKLTQEGR
ncbi:MAG: tol-pal system protein YbgF [Gammaproteobacteria bacterium]|nr:tol-pal system protein YbgF [Gammaproteobacteria bacterium]